MDKTELRKGQSILQFDRDPKSSVANPKRHALMVVFHYAPEASSTGVLRTLKYTRYMPTYGWRSTVIAPNISAYASTDLRLEDQIPHDTVVVRTPYLNIKRHLSIAKRYPGFLAIPDQWIGWYPWAVKAAIKVIERDRPEVIYSTSPHPTAHLIARHLAKRTGIPWVADFRDPWYEEPPEPGTPWLVHWASRHLESSVIRQASAVVATTPQHATTMSRRYPTQSPEKFHSVRNGFDEADFTHLDVKASTQLTSRLVIMHAGTINASYRRDPRPLLYAIARLAANHQIALSDIEVQLMGPGDGSFVTQLRQELSMAPYSEFVRFMPRVSYDESLAAMCNSDVLLLLEASEDTQEMVPAKLYEYLRIGRPVLALCYPGAMQDVIEAVEGGWAVDPRQQEGLQICILDIYQRWQRGELSKRWNDAERLRPFSREMLTGELVNIFNSLTTAS